MEVNVPNFEVVYLPQLLWMKSGIVKDIRLLPEINWFVNYNEMTLTENLPPYSTTILFPTT